MKSEINPNQKRVPTWILCRNVPEISDFIFDELKSADFIFEKKKSL